MTAHGHWWERRETVILLMIASTMPLWWPAVPPLTDLPGHMGRYRVQLDGGATASLRQFYTFEWALIGNLGVDLLIIPVSKLIGLEPGVKLIVMTIPAITVGGLLWIAREVHGEVPPTALFALPLAYGNPFLFGFANFALAMALALVAFALWLRLARLRKLRFRAVVFLLIAPLLWLVHTFGWGLLGLLAFSAETVRQHDRGIGLRRACAKAALHCLVLTPPIALMVLWRTGHVGGQTADWFNWPAKWLWFEMTLRDRWRAFDLVALALLMSLVPLAWAHKRLKFSRNLGLSALVLAAAFLLLPRIVFGSAYADMRLTPYVLAVAIVGIRLRPGASARFAQGLALAGLAFFAVRTAGTTASFAIGDAQQDAQLEALDHVPRGARLVSFAGAGCGTPWAHTINWHLAAMAIVRRDAFSNDQWQMAGAQLLRVRKGDAGWFGADPSNVVVGGPCPNKWRTLDWSLANLPRNAFDYVWLIDPPRFDPRGLRGMTLVWTKGTGALYRIVDRRMLSPRP